MGKEDQCLLCCRNKNDWELKGLYRIKDLKDAGIIFYILGHVLWKMEIGKRSSVKYKYGNYIMEEDTFKVKQLEKSYKNIFQKEPQSEIKTIFKEVIFQEHGTILIIIQKEAELDSDRQNNIDKETERLIQNSTGIKIIPSEIKKRFYQQYNKY